MNIAILILTILGIISDLVELTYDAGAFTRQHILPALIMAYVVSEHYTQLAWDYLTSQEWELKVYNTPVSTGFAYG